LKPKHESEDIEQVGNLNDDAVNRTKSDLQTLNGDMSRPARMRSQEMEWQPSPSGTVWRKRLHLVGDAESGQVTSIVRYDAGASFPGHDHPDGEEIFVLDGVFSDEHGDWAAGTHLLNPEGFRHAPFSREGCVILVKLRQYAGDGRAYQKTNSLDLKWSATDRKGIEEKHLYEDPRFPDTTQLERWAPGTRWNDPAPAGGCEIYVIEGAVQDEFGHYPAGCWMRVPDGTPVALVSEKGAVLYKKSGAVSSLRTAASPV
jgi:anti-sigma factor ChrR (cupin superfamily)